MYYKESYEKDNNVRGMGNGLFLVNRIIEYYSGKIWVENRIDNDYTKGSNSVVEIPEAN